MNENPSPPLEPYPCNKIVYRAALFRDWIKGAKIKKQAFYRLEKDQAGVSVSPTPEDCSRELTDPAHGIIALHVGWVRDLGLDIIPDSPTHATIVGIPTRNHDYAKAMYLAAELAKIARSL